MTVSLHSLPLGRILGVREAYNAIDAFSRRFGERPLRLLLHLGVPQSFRADLVNLIKINFVDASAGLDVDAEVLFSPLIEETAGGFHRLDVNVRRHCLMLLDAAYRDQPERRSVQIARFLFVYIENAERQAAQIRDPLLAEYLAAHRWVALAFINPVQATAAFARVLREATDRTEVAARLQLGSVAAAIEIPLAGQQDLLAYARGLDALVSGDFEHGRTIMKLLGDRDLEFGGIRLPAPTSVLSTFAETAQVPADRAHREQGGRTETVIRRVYLSSTGQDLHKYRRAVFDVLKTKNIICDLLEDWPAGAASPTDRIRSKIFYETDGIIFILGFRYGWIPEDQYKSIVELEYDWATEKWGQLLNPPVWIFRPSRGSKAETELRKSAEEFPDDARQRQLSSDRQAAFINRLLRQDRLIGEFSDVADLGERVIRGIFFWNQKAQRRQRSEALPVEPSLLIDRVAEQELFRSLLTFEDDARLLAINDAAGRGKSALLRRLRYNCLWQVTPGIPNSLISWNEHPGWHFFDLIEAIHNDLDGHGLRFPEFSTLHTHLALKDFTAFKGATISGGTQAGRIMGRIVEGDYFTPPQSPQPWSAEMEEEAQKQCVSTFLKELWDTGNKQPVVIMFDAWERCAESLKSEILNRLIRPFCLDVNTRPKWLLLVIAGREPFPFKQMLGDTLFSRLVRSVESLSKWERNHVKEFLSVNGYNKMSDEDIDSVFRVVEKGMSLRAVINFAKTLGLGPIMNFDNELGAFKKIATGEDTQTRLILVTGDGGMGKSYLLNLYQQVAYENNVDVILFGLDPLISVQKCIAQMVGHLGYEHFRFYDDFLIQNPHQAFAPPAEKSWQRNLTERFVTDLGRYAGRWPIAIFFDQYERADSVFKEWLNEVFVPSIATEYHIIVVIAGREYFDPPPSARGSLDFPLTGVTVDWYRRYAEDFKVAMDSRTIDMLHEVLRGRPKEFADYVKAEKVQRAQAPHNK